MARTPSAQSDPLFYLLSSTGEELARFGRATMEEFDPETWQLSPARDGGFWTASIWKYAAHRWISPDSPRTTFVREAGWYRRTFATIVEVVDLESARLIATPASTAVSARSAEAV